MTQEAWSGLSSCRRPVFVYWGWGTWYTTDDVYECWKIYQDNPWNGDEDVNKL